MNTYLFVMTMVCFMCMMVALAADEFDLSSNIPFFGNVSEVDEFSIPLF
ncbi:hypothetical protein V1503_05160 [Bacillus sp. SCS-151]